jgi:hypothetical protein
MRNLASSILFLILTIAALPTLAQVPRSESQPKQAVIGMVIWVQGNRPIGFGSGLTIRLGKGSRNYETKTDNGGFFKMSLYPGEYRIKSIYQDSKRFRLYKHQSKSLSIEMMPTAVRADIYVIKP